MLEKEVWENGIAEKAGFEVSLGSKQDTSKSRRGEMAQTRVDECSLISTG